MATAVWRWCTAAEKGAENYHINLIIMIFTAANNYNYAKLFNNYCLLTINRNIMSFTTLIVHLSLCSRRARCLLYAGRTVLHREHSANSTSDGIMIMSIICRESHFCIRNR